MNKSPQTRDVQSPAPVQPRENSLVRRGSMPGQTIYYEPAACFNWCLCPFVVFWRAAKLPFAEVRRRTPSVAFSVTSFNRPHQVSTVSSPSLEDTAAAYADPRASSGDLSVSAGNRAGLRTSTGESPNAERSAIARSTTSPRGYAPPELPVVPQGAVPSPGVGADVFPPVAAPAKCMLPNASDDQLACNSPQAGAVAVNSAPVNVLQSHAADAHAFGSGDSSLRHRLGASKSVVVHRSGPSRPSVEHKRGSYSTLGAADSLLLPLLDHEDLMMDDSDDDAAGSGGTH